MAANCLVKRESGVGEQSLTVYDNGIDKFFSKDNFEKLQSIMYQKRVEAGSYLFMEGEKTGKLYYLRSGRVKIRKTTEEGRDLILSILQRGDLIGEFGEDSDEFYYSAEVIESGEIGVIQLKDLVILLYRQGDFAVQFMKWIGLMQRIVQTKFRDLLLFGKPGALASTLIRLSNTYGVAGKDGILLNIKLTNFELADLIGTTRESVNRMLSGLKDEGTIGVVNGKIVIRRLSNLRQICNCPTYPACPKEICRI